MRRTNPDLAARKCNMGDDGIIRCFSRRGARMSNPYFPRCKWITLSDGIRQFWCGAQLIWSSYGKSTHKESLTMLSPSRYHRRRSGRRLIRRSQVRLYLDNLRRRAINPVVVGGGVSPHIAIRPGVKFSPISVDFSGFSGQQVGQQAVMAPPPATAAAISRTMSQMQVAPWLGRMQYGTPKINVERNRRSQFRGVIIDNYGVPTPVTVWLGSYGDAYRAAVDWIRMNS